MIEYVSFSGGRTSGYMLRRVIDASSETPLVIFANTGKEDEKTLEFVDTVSRVWLCAHDSSRTAVFFHGCGQVLVYRLDPPRAKKVQGKK